MPSGAGGRAKRCRFFARLPIPDVLRVRASEELDFRGFRPDISAERWDCQLDDDEAEHAWTRPRRGPRETCGGERFDAAGGP
jgi:hypothetical protein